MWKYDAYKELDDHIIDPFNPNNHSKNYFPTMYCESNGDRLWDSQKEISEEDLRKIDKKSDIFCISIIVLLCITVLLFIVFISIGE